MKEFPNPSSVFSLAVSIKMNILLFAPALLLAYIATQGIYGTIKQLSICAGIQVILTTLSRVVQLIQRFCNSLAGSWSTFFAGQPSCLPQRIF